MCLYGVFWGAFDPATKAHGAIIEAALKRYPLDKLFLVVNNHGYKRYTYPVAERIASLQAWLKKKGLQDKVEILTQDDSHPWDYEALFKKTGAKLIAISGYDAYHRWRKHAQIDSLSAYEKIVVIPRVRLEGDPLFDANAEWLPIDEKYLNVSSQKVKEIPDSGFIL